MAYQFGLLQKRVCGLCILRWREARSLMDAKKMSEDVASTIDVHVKDYAAHIKPEDIPHTVGNWNGYQVPFLFASNGRAYLEQLRTKSGIWFLDVREQENQPYPIRNWFSPSD